MNRTRWTALACALILFSTALSAQYTVRSRFNTSKVNLAAGESFVGIPEQPEHNNYVVGVLSDQPGLLRVEFSFDGTTFQDPITDRTREVGVLGLTFVKGILLTRFIRVTHTNTGSVPTTRLVVFTTFGNSSQLSNGLNDTIAPFSDTVITKPIPFGIPTSLGFALGYAVKTAVGDNLNINPNDTPEDIWGGDGLYTGHPTPCPAEPLELFSSSADDTLAGTGAQTVEVQFLDDDYVRVIEVIEMNGLTSVSSVSDACRFGESSILTVGTEGTNVGIITFRGETTEATVFGIMPIALGQTQFGGFTVPANTTAVIRSVEVTIFRNQGRAGAASFRLLIRPKARHSFEHDLGTGAPLALEFQGLRVPERMDVLPRIEQVSGTGTRASVVLQYVLVDDI